MKYFKYAYFEESDYVQNDDYYRTFYGPKGWGGSVDAARYALGGMAELFPKCTVTGVIAFGEGAKYPNDSMFGGIPDSDVKLEFKRTPIREALAQFESLVKEKNYSIGEYAANELLFHTKIGDITDEEVLKLLKDIQNKNLEDLEATKKYFKI